jgi:hypothetical protein
MYQQESEGARMKLNYTEQCNLPTSGYRPSEYWIERGKTYQDRFKYTKEFKLQERMLLHYMRSIFPPFSSVLDIGCGFGRIIKLVTISKYPEIYRYGYFTPSDKKCE